MKKTTVDGPLKVLGVFESPSKYGGDIYDIKMEDDQGNELRSYVDPQNHNFKNWTKVIDGVLKQDKLITIDGSIFYKTEKGQLSLHRRTKRPLIDADSKPEIVKAEPNLEAQEYARRRQQFKIKQLRTLRDIAPGLGITEQSGRWEPESAIHQSIVDFTVNKEDDIDTIRAKLEVLGILRYALDLNQGLHQ